MWAVIAIPLLWISGFMVGAFLARRVVIEWYEESIEESLSEQSQEAVRAAVARRRGGA